MKRVCIHQPDFVPYLGFFDRLLSTDVFILLDDAQFLRRGWHHRDRIKTRQGSDWLTLPVEKSPQTTPINHMRLAPTSAGWQANLLNQLQENYRDAAHFSKEFPWITELLSGPFERLVDLNLAFLKECLRRFELQPEIVLASSLGVAGARTQRLVDLVRAVGGTSYLSGTGALDYLEPERFVEAGITLTIQDFRHPVYPQLHGPFMPYLSCLDALLNCGSDVAEILRAKNVQETGP
ncbi:WbqC family protein [Azospirillum formosense]|nr:WbqC family protein [Azospirillum formosense]MBY3757591.1 WbqC family protein [Azospirillum formosense]